MEFDFAERGWDLLDFWRGKITLRRMTVLLKHMPRESAFVRAVVGGPHWTQMDALLLIGDLLAGANWQRVGDPNLTRPESLPRPGDERRQEEEDARWSALMEAQVAALNRGEQA